MSNSKTILEKLETWTLRASLFLIFGAISTIRPFLEVYMKNKGLNIKEIAFFYIILSCLKALFVIGSGVIIDKIGHPKCVILGALVLAILMLNGTLFVPNITSKTCKRDISYNVQMSCCNKATFPSNLSTINSTEIRKWFLICNCNENITNITCYNLNNSIDNSYKTYVNETSETNISWNNKDQKLFILLNNIDYELEDYQTKQIIVQQELLLLCDNKSRINSDNDSCLLLNSSCVDESPCKVMSDKNSLMYFILLLICFLGYQTMIPCVTHSMDIIIMSLVKTHGLDFGRERILPTVSEVLFPVLSGYVVNLLTEQKKHAPYYEIAIYLFDIFAVFSIISISSIKIKLEKRETQLFNKSIFFLMNINTVIFLITVLILGTCMNFQLHFTSLYLDYLGASSFLLALIPAVQHLYGLPFLVFSNFFIRKGTENRFLILAFIGYIINFIGYAYLRNPWWALILEVTGIITYHLVWVAIVRRSYDLAPKGLLSTIIATSGALHFCIGTGTSSLLGGLVMSKFGGRTAFKVMAITAGVFGFFYTFYLGINILHAKWHKKNIEGDVTSENQR